MVFCSSGGGGGGGGGGVGVGAGGGGGAHQIRTCPWDHVCDCFPVPYTKRNACDYAIAGLSPPSPTPCPIKTRHTVIVGF